MTQPLYTDARVEEVLAWLEQAAQPAPNTAPLPERNKDSHAAANIAARLTFSGRATYQLPSEEALLLP